MRRSVPSASGARLAWPTARATLPNASSGSDAPGRTGTGGASVGSGDAVTLEVSRERVHLAQRLAGNEIHRQNDVDRLFDRLRKSRRRRPDWPGRWPGRFQEIPRRSSVLTFLAGEGRCWAEDFLEPFLEPVDLFDALVAVRIGQKNVQADRPWRRRPPCRRSVGRSGRGARASGRGFPRIPGRCRRSGRCR